jgi:hypothetical protein
MGVHSDRSWRFDAPPDVVWAAISDVDRYQQWWPWLRRFDAAAFATGERWRCTIKPQLPYQLRFDIVLEAVVDGESAAARLDGDLSGRAHLSLVADAAGDGCSLRLVSDLDAVGGPARMVSRFAPGLASAGHDWVLDRGIRQFRSHALARRVDDEE